MAQMRNYSTKREQFTIYFDLLQMFMSDCPDSSAPITGWAALVAQSQSEAVPR
jgi:hypothetical protein